MHQLLIIKVLLFFFFLAFRFIIFKVLIFCSYYPSNCLGIAPQHFNCTYIILNHFSQNILKLISKFIIILMLLNTFLYSSHWVIWFKFIIWFFFYTNLFLFCFILFRLIICPAIFNFLKLLFLFLMILIETIIAYLIFICIKLLKVLKIILINLICLVLINYLLFHLL